MNVFRHFRDRVCDSVAALSDAGTLPTGLNTDRITVEAPRDPAHGDLSTNAAMVLAKPAGMKPRDLAALLLTELAKLPQVTEAGIAGPGFINLRLADDFWRERLRDILLAGKAYGESEMGRGVKVNVEYVSANPTGPLHIAHARGAVIGDALAGLLAKAGYDVTKEYYVNDAGAQVDTLARSTFLRYREALGESIGEIPPGMYPGEYLKSVGQALAERDGTKWLDVAEEDWLPEIRSFAIERMMDLVREDLHALGVDQDVFTSERALVEAGAVEQAVAVLRERGLVYEGVLEPPKGKPVEDWEPVELTLFRSTDFGDDVDRPIKKSDGSWTYLAGDMANHYDKYRRGFTRQINIWGADHSGQVKRTQAAVTALTNGEASLNVQLCQLVKLQRGGVEVKMSKRAGTFVTLREVIDEVGKDVVRFIMLTRKNDAPLDFDLEKVVEQSRENPVFYVQYAHARGCSVQRHAVEEFLTIPQDDAGLADVDLNLLTDSGELALIKKLAEWPRMVEAAAEAYEPHRIAFYLQEVAASFHGLWTRGKDDTALRFLQADNEALSVARLAMVRAVLIVIGSGLATIGVTPIEEMR